MTPELWIMLLTALVSVESPKTEAMAKAAIAREGAYGCLQIRQCCLDDVNRVYKTRITLSQCEKSESVSRWVCVQYLKYWGKHYEKQTGNDATPEVLARIWNGGPSGWKRKSTQEYWRRVSDEINILR